MPFLYREIFLATYTRCFCGFQVGAWISHTLQCCFSLKAVITIPFIDRRPWQRMVICQNQSQPKTACLLILWSWHQVVNISFLANIVRSRFAESTKFQLIPVEQPHSKSCNHFRLVIHHTTILEMFEMSWGTTAAENNVILEVPYQVKLQVLTKIQIRLERAFTHLWNRW